jgi:hypothetical protein
MTMTDNDWKILARYGVTPDNLTVGGSLDLSDTPITALPDNLTVGWSLDLRGTAITALPDNLTVAGSLYLSGTRITALLDNLTVGGSLYLSYRDITALPDNMTVAIAHWGASKYPDKARGAAFVAVVLAEENRRNASK